MIFRSTNLHHVRAHATPGLGVVACALVLAACSALSGCSNGLQSVDRRANSLMVEHAERMGDHVIVPDLETPDVTERLSDPSMEKERLVRTDLETVDPAIDRFAFREDTGDRSLAELLEFYTSIPPDVPRYGLEDILRLAVANSREYLTAKEELFLAALRLMEERHLFGPRFFDEISASYAADGEDGDYDLALNLANEFRVTQRLQRGGNISARMIVSATEQLRQTVSDNSAQSATMIVSADIPLLRGAGDVARESLISAEREMVYATRTFERFRRQFLFDIANDYFSLVLAARRVENAGRVLESRGYLLDESEALFKSGRRADIEVNEARQRFLQGQSSLASARDSYVVALEQLRIRLGLPPDNPLLIDTEDSLEFAVPELDMEESVRRGLLYRLDLQNTRDRVDDTRRSLRNVRNDLLPDLNLSASVEAITDPDLRRSGLQFDLDETDFQASVTYGLPLDRETERIGLRRAVISVERAERNLRESEDEVSLSVRRAIRDIQLARFSLNLQEESIRIIERRLEALEIQKERGTVNARTIIDAQDELEQALQSREQELRNVRVAVMRYLLETGQFRVAPDGKILLPPDLKPIAPPNEADEDEADASAILSRLELSIAHA